MLPSLPLRPVRALGLAVLACVLCVLVPSPSAVADEAAPRVRLATTLGDIVLALDPERAPRTVANFLEYVDAGYYDGTLVHRVIEGFMIQGGGFTERYARKPTRAPIPNEADNALSNRRYTIAMARTNEPHSATAQFFINVADNPNLDHRDRSLRGWGYAVFGRVVEGEETVERIAAVPTGAAGPFGRDAPREPVMIVEARRLDARPASSDAAPAATGMGLEEPASARPAAVTGNGSAGTL